MNNICYKIYDNNNNNDNDNDNDNFDHLMNDIKISIYNDNILALQTDYNTNFNIKQLKLIIAYYKIELKKRNLKKKELINEIINFELNNNNKNIVNKRKQIWFYITQLKEDSFFNKYILIDI